MITVWRMPIVATVDQIVKDIKLQLYGKGIYSLIYSHYAPPP